MNDKEIAMQLTLKAMETGAIIRFVANRDASNESVESANEKNSRFVCDFYKAMLETISSVTHERS